MFVSLWRCKGQSLDPAFIENRYIYLIYHIINIQCFDIYKKYQIFSNLGPIVYFLFDIRARYINREGPEKDHIILSFFGPSLLGYVSCVSLLGDGQLGKLIRNTGITLDCRQDITSCYNSTRNMLKVMKLEMEGFMRKLDVFELCILHFKIVWYCIIFAYRSHCLTMSVCEREANTYTILRLA